MSSVDKCLDPAHFQQLLPHRLHPGFLAPFLQSAFPPTPNQRCKLSKTRRASSYVAEYTACIPQGLWCHPRISYGNRSFKDNKTRLPTGIVNTLQHTLVPRSSIGSVESLNLDWTQAGTTAHTHTHTREKGGQLHRGSQDAASQNSTACCMTRVGTEWELVHCPSVFLSICLCVFLWLWLSFSGQKWRSNDPFFKKISLFFTPVFTAAMPLLSLLFVSVATGISHTISLWRCCKMLCNLQAVLGKLT